MKKVFAMLAITSVMVACNSGDDKAAETKMDTAATTVTTTVDTTAKVVVDTMAAKVDTAAKK